MMENKKKRESVGNEWCSKITFTTLRVKVKFPCRLFMEFQVGRENRCTRQIKIDSKSEVYHYNQEIFWSKQHSSQQKKETLAITVKLLSNRGLVFTAGTFAIQQKDLSNTGKTVTYQVAKLSDIEVRCCCKFEWVEEGTLIGRLDEIKQDAQESSKLQVEERDGSVQNIAETSYNAVLPQFSKVNEKIDKKMEEKKGNFYDNKVFEVTNLRGLSVHEYTSRGVKQKNEDEKEMTLHKQLAGYSQLYERQKEMIEMLEKKLRESTNQQQRLNTKLNRFQVDMEKKKQKINELQQERITFMSKGVDSQKKMNRFKESLKKLLWKTDQEITEALTKFYQQEKTQLQVKVADVKGKKEETESETPLKFTPNNVCQNGLKEGSDFEKSDEDTSMNMLQISDIAVCGAEKDGYVYAVKKQNESFEHLKVKGQSQLDDCLLQLKAHCSEVLIKIQRYSGKISRKMLKLGRSNSSYRQKLKQSRQYFENNQQSLLSYLQQLQSSLQMQLQITTEKQHAIEGYLETIEELTEKICGYEAKFKELQEMNGKLMQEKQFIKGEFHENNYLFSVREQELLKKIQELQGQLSSLAPQRHLSELNLKQSFSVYDIQSENQSDPQDLLNQYCQRIRDKQMELLYQRKEKQRLLEQLQSKQDEMRGTMLRSKRVQLAMKFKERISSSDCENDKSFEMTEEQIGEKKSYMQQQFLRILT